MAFRKNGWVVDIFKSPRIFNIIFDIYDLQGDGEIMFCLAILWRTLKIVIPFNGEKHKFRYSFWLFRTKPTGLGTPQKISISHADLKLLKKDADARFVWENNYNKLKKSVEEEYVPKSTYENMVKERAEWKEAWYQQRQATGRASSYEYYRGLLLGLRQSPTWTTAMYQIAGRVAVHLSSIYKTGPGLAKIYADRPVVPQLDAKHKPDVLREINKFLK